MCTQEKGRYCFTFLVEHQFLSKFHVGKWTPDVLEHYQLQQHDEHEEKKEALSSATNIHVFTE